MLFGQKGIKYGLTVPESRKKAATVKPAPKLAAFGGDNSDGEHEAVPQQLARQAASKKSNAKVAEMHAAAMAEDPSVFDYDGVYDSMQKDKAAPVAAERKNRSSKYIESLLDKAKERDREQDIIFERRQVKERQVEDHLFGDKEKFVTAAYKKKLQERQLWEAQQKLKDKRDEENAAHAKGDMSGFYGNLLTKNVAFGAEKSEKSAGVAAEQNIAEDAAAPSDAATNTDAASADNVEQRASGQAAVAASVMEAPAAPFSGRPETADAGAEPASRSPRARGSDDAARPQGASSVAKKESGPAAEPPASRPPPVRHTDSAAAAAARERYLARKRKAASEPDV